MFINEDVVFMINIFIQTTTAAKTTLAKRVSKPCASSLTASIIIEAALLFLPLQISGARS
jgi:hypothetical protein